MRGPPCGATGPRSPPSALAPKRRRRRRQDTHKDPPQKWNATDGWRLAAKTKQHCLRQIDVRLKVSRLLSCRARESPQGESRGPRRAWRLRDGSAPGGRSQPPSSSDFSFQTAHLRGTRANSRQYVASCWMNPAAGQPARRQVLAAEERISAVRVHVVGFGPAGRISSHFVGIQGWLATQSGGKSRRPHRTMDSAHGIREIVRIPASPSPLRDVCAKPLLTACHAPSSGSETHQASSPACPRDEVRLTVSRRTVDDDVLELRVVSGRATESIVCRQVLHCG